MLACLLPASLIAAAGVGGYPIPPWKMLQALLYQGDGYAALVYVRFPRVFLAAATGALLAVSGTAMQGVFRNPLADPGLIGVTAGAGFGAALWIVLIGSGALEIWGTPAAAFVCGMVVVAAVWKAAETEGQFHIMTLLLAGIALNSVAGAGIGLMTFLADDEQLRSLTFWLLGGFGGATWTAALVALPAAAVGLFMLLRLALQLNAFALGESDAYHLGVHVESLKRNAMVGAALSVGAAVSIAGGIGFVGLVVPHLLRLIGGADHRYVLPGSALGGASLLVLADLASRTVVLPAELPVGVVTSLFGGPFFLWLLIRYKRTLIAGTSYDQS